MKNYVSKIFLLSIVLSVVILGGSTTASSQVITSPPCSEGQSNIAYAEARRWRWISPALSLYFYGIGAFWDCD